MEERSCKEEVSDSVRNRAICQNILRCDFLMNDVRGPLAVLQIILCPRMQAKAVLRSRTAGYSFPVNAALAEKPLYRIFVTMHN